MPRRRDALTAARQAAGFSQQEAAKRAGFRAKSAWCMLESGQANPSLAAIIRIAKALNRPAVELFPELGEHPAMVVN